ncbi:MAG: hypothetical protein IPH72_07975 [Sandaracinaceae bacterium]|nr:hypothetical protein [Sandaracinaceae bacterium]
MGQRHRGPRPVRNTTDPLVRIIGACARAGNPNRPIVFASTSKTSFARVRGVACLATSAANVADIKLSASRASVGQDEPAPPRALLHGRRRRKKAHLSRSTLRCSESLSSTAVDRVAERANKGWAGHVDQSREGGVLRQQPRHARRMRHTGALVKPGRRPGRGQARAGRSHAFRSPRYRNLTHPRGLYAAARLARCETAMEAVPLL